MILSPDKLEEIIEKNYNPGSGSFNIAEIEKTIKQLGVDEAESYFAFMAYHGPTYFAGNAFYRLLSMAIRGQLTSNQVRRLIQSAEKAIHHDEDYFSRCFRGLLIQEKYINIILAYLGRMIKDKTVPDWPMWSFEISVLVCSNYQKDKHPEIYIRIKNLLNYLLRETRKTFVFVQNRKQIVENIELQLKEL